MGSTRANFHVVRLQKRATLAVPEILQIKDQLLKGEHIAQARSLKRGLILLYFSASDGGPETKSNLALRGRRLISASRCEAPDRSANRSTWISFGANVSVCISRHSDIVGREPPSTSLFIP
jgi:hypothetical protein